MKNLKTKFTNYEVVITEDNTTTLYSEHFDENCHSLSGAKSETLYNYIQGCELSRFITKKKEETINILEVGFGLGIGLLTTIDYFFKQRQSGQKISFTSLEIDPELVEYTIKQNKNNYPFLENLKLKTKNDISFYYHENENLKITILLGDATKTLESAHTYFHSEKYHAIYQDAFSPRKNPELWTKKWFLLLRQLSKKDVILSTYSASGSVKNALREAGFFIFNKKGFHLKKNMTIAKLEENICQN